MDENLKERKAHLMKNLKKRSAIIVYFLLAILVGIGYWIRTKNLWLLKDATNGQYIPLALDPYVFLRYVQHIVEKGSLYSVDYLRNYPVGFPMSIEVPVLQYVIAYLYKIMHFFNPSVTVEYAHVLYPAIAFAIGLVFFFLFIRRIFDEKIALLSTAFLTVIPSFLYRTMAGFSDKEALATMFMFIALYFFIRGWQEKNLKSSLISAVISALFVVLMGLSWGGVNFVFLIVGAFITLLILLNNFKVKDFYFYTTWFLVLVPILILSTGRFTPSSWATSFTSLTMNIAFVMGLIYYFVFHKNLLKIKTKINSRIPQGLGVLLITIAVFLVIILIYDPSFLIEKPANMLRDMLIPYIDRWALTVAESHEPYIVDWAGQFGWNFVWLFIGGSILLFYEIVKHIKKYRIQLTLGYTVFILGFIFSRYSSSSILNGTSNLAKLLYIGSLVGFAAGILIFYINRFYKDKNTFEKISKLKTEYVFVLIFFVILIMGARRAIRLLYIFSPAIAILAGYTFFQVARYFKNVKSEILKLGAYILIAIVALTMLNGFYENVSNQAQYTGPSYNQQWQQAMSWVRENTPEDAVFGHWWDYGYWVQTGGRRATVTDGGNAIGWWNHLMGRHALTGQSDQEALEFLYSHGVTHFLMISDEIGKYPAYSSIGADANYDRYSWINPFTMDQTQTQETRDGQILLYRGGWAFDDDFIYKENIYPKQSSGIGGFFIPFQNVNGTPMFKQPSAIVFYQNKQEQVPVECLVFQKQEFIFELPEGEGLKGCFQIVPKIDGQQGSPIGSGFYLSEDVRKGRFAQYYMFDKKSPYYELVYTDEQAMPLSIYNGRTIGPLKIWKINYPEGMEINPDHLSTQFLDTSVLAV